MKKQTVVLVILGIVCISLALLFIIPLAFPYTYNRSSLSAQDEKGILEKKAEEKPKVTHVQTPEHVKGVYMTSWVSGTPRLRNSIVTLLDTTEANAVVIDVKDYTGKLSFEVRNPELKAYGSQDIRVADMREFIQTLHDKNIYVIGRVAVFQDMHMTKVKPEWAVKTRAGAVWKDRKGISWIDPGTKDYWGYVTLVAQEMYDAGFDEINLDYIRFPTDGNMKDMVFPWSGETPKHEIIKNFFVYVGEHLPPIGIKVSADIFGMTLSAQDDLGIGQIVADILPHVDAVCPMVYPSHYASGFDGFSNPAQHPYEVIHKALSDGLVKEDAIVGTTTPTKFRPWYQDFDLGADYNAKEVRAQIQAGYDLGVNSWLIWSPSNVYSPGGLLSE